MDKKIVRNYLYSAAYQVLTILTPLVTTPYISRVLHRDGIGTFSYTSTIAGAFALFAGLGFNVYGQREIAYRQGDAKEQSIVLFEILLVRAGIVGLVTAAYVTFSIWYSKYTFYLLPQVLTIVAVMVDVSWFFQGNEDFRTTVVRNAIVKVASVVLTFVLVRRSSDLIVYVILNCASTLLGNLYYVPLLRRHVMLPRRESLRPLRHMRGTIEFFVPILAVQIYSYLDKIMLGYFMTTTVESGYYEQARKITTLVVGIIIALNNVMMSRISRMYASGRDDDIVFYYKRAYSVIVMMTLPVCFGLYLVSDNFVLWFFGEEFSKVSELMRLSSLLTLFMCVGNFVGVQYLTPTGQQNKMTVAYVTAAVTNIVLNLMLIPRLGSIGAMVASVIAEFISCGIQMRYLLVGRYRFNVVACVPRYLAASLLMSAAIMCRHISLSIMGPISTFLDICLGATVYGGALLLMGDENVRGAILKWRPR